MDRTDKPRRLSALLLWDVQEKKELYRLAWPLDEAIIWRDIMATFSPDGTQLAVHWSSSAFQGKSLVWVYDATTGKPRCRCGDDASWPETGLPRVRQLQFSPDGNALLVKKLEYKPREPVQLWDTTTGKLRHRLLLPADNVWAVSFGDGGASLHIAADQTVQVWPAEKSKPFSVSTDPEGGIFYRSLSGDGQRLAVRQTPAADMRKSFQLYKLHTIRVFDMTRGNELLTIKDLPGVVKILQLSRDGTRLVAHVGGMAGHTPEPTLSELVVWNVATGVGRAYPLPAALAQMGPPGFEMSHQVEAFSGDGQLAAFTYRRAKDEVVLKVWKLPDEGGGAQCQEILERVFSNTKLYDTKFSPDGRLLIFCLSSSRYVNIVDLQTAKDLSSFEVPKLLPGTRRDNAVHAISPDGKLLAWPEDHEGSGPTRDIVIVDLQGKEKRRLTGLFQKPTMLVFSPDGQRLASLAPASGPPSSPASVEIKLWDLHNGQEVLTLTEELAALVPPYSWFQFSDDGHRLFLVARSSTGFGCEVHTWNATPLPVPPP
jgi:WD40 repeat protein